MGRDVIAPHEFSVGALEGWHGVLLGLFGSAVLLLSGRQDLNKARRQKLETPFGLLAFFWFPWRCSPLEQWYGWVSVPECGEGRCWA